MNRITSSHTHSEAETNSWPSANALRILARMIAMQLQQKARQDEEDKNQPPIDAKQKPENLGFEQQGRC